MQPLEILQAPDYCGYVNGRCEQNFDSVPDSGALFLYPSNPPQIATTIAAGVSRLRTKFTDKIWTTWEDLPIQGQIVFHEICKAARRAQVIFTDVTTLNFNLLFEIGFCIGLGQPVLPIRDTSLLTSTRDFDELSVLKTLGYIDFQNSDQLAEQIASLPPTAPLPPVQDTPRGDSPLYVMRDPFGLDGSIEMIGTIKKAKMQFRAYDPLEQRLNLHNARRQVARSFGVVAHLIRSDRKNALIHNGLCAFVCGIATAQSKVVVMLHEGDEPQPIDYRDLVHHYRSPSHIAGILDGPLREVVRQIQEAWRAGRPQEKDESLLQKLDLGDVAAENEIRDLDEYYVPSGGYALAKKGHARLVVGRKGTGKTALFYQIRQPLITLPNALVLDLRPEGHQFTRLKEVLTTLTPGIASHTLTAFWSYILLAELAREIVADENYARMHPTRFECWTRVRNVYQKHDPGYEADFSQRLLRQIDRISREISEQPSELGASMTEIIYKGDVRELSEAITNYLAEKKLVWLLVDNLDKGWPTHGTSDIDISLVIALLEATRKLQGKLVDIGTDFKSLVLLRTDIYERLRLQLPDKGKDTPILLDGEDRKLLKNIVEKRIAASTEINETFEEIWPRLVVSHVGTEPSFDYIADRTLMRPRDLLGFIRAAMEVAINRSNSEITEDDILTAETSYSEELVLVTADEINDTYPGYGDVLYEFQGLSSMLAPQELSEIFNKASIISDHHEKLRDMLLWFAFLGVSAPIFEGEKYSYSVRFNIRHLMQGIESGDGYFVIHPAFRAALNIQ